MSLNFSGYKEFMQRFFLVFFGLAIAFLLLEAGLRFAGYIYSEYRTKDERPCAGDEDAVRILCIGDSYTFGHGAPAGYSYPEQLERILNRDNRGSKFIVYNRGVPGANSSQMLNRLPDNLKRYRPEAVVILAGMDNGWNLYESNYFLFKKGIKASLYRIDAFLSRLRSYKLLKIIVASLPNKLLQSGIRSPGGQAPDIVKRDDVQVMAEDERLSPEAGRRFELGKEYMALRAINDSIEEFKKVIESNPRHYQSLVYLGDNYYCREDYGLAERVLKKAIGIAPNNAAAYEALWKVYWQWGKRNLALETIRQELQLDPFNDELRRILRSGLPYALKEKEIFDKVLEYDLENMFRLIRSTGAKIVLLTYPIGDYEVKNSLAEKWQIPFVDTKKSFDRLKLSGNYRKEDYFVEDYHCNSNGYRIMAQDIYETLKSETGLLE